MRLFVNLHHRPRSLSEAFEIARAVCRISPQDRQGRLCVGNSEIIGTYIRAPLSQGGCASLRETTLADNRHWISGRNASAAPGVRREALYD